MSLDDQAEQLDNIEGNLDKINNDMAESEKAIKDMDRAFGIIPKFWKTDKGFKEDKETWGEAKPSKGFEKAEALEIREGAYVAKITGDDREEEMEENMEQVKADFSIILLQQYKKKKKHKKIISGWGNDRQPAEHGERHGWRGELSFFHQFLLGKV